MAYNPAKAFLHILAIVLIGAAILIGAVIAVASMLVDAIKALLVVWLGI